jgi:hypothetical protein
MTGLDRHGEEKMSCPIGVPTPDRPANSQSLHRPPASKSVGPPNYGVAEAPTSYLTLSSLWTASQNSLRYLQTVHDCRHNRHTKPNQTKQLSAQGHNSVRSHVICSESTLLSLQSLFPATQEAPYSPPTPRGTLTQNITTDFEDYKNCGATSILAADRSKQSPLSCLKRSSKSKTTP